MATTTDLTSKIVKPGERIVTKGEPADTAYLIDSGSVRVYIERNDKIVEIATLGADEIFGETALIKGASYGANVDAVEETELTLITPSILESKMGNCDPMLKAIIQMLIERLKRTNKELVKSETREFMDIGFV